MRKATWRDLIHCDNCGAVVMPCEHFCSWCGRERICFAWQPVPLFSEGWLRREAMGSAQQYGPLVLLHCDWCYSVCNEAADNFCGFCRKPIKDIQWRSVPLSSPAFRERELLRRQLEQKTKGERTDYKTDYKKYKRLEIEQVIKR